MKRLPLKLKRLLPRAKIAHFNGRKLADGYPDIVGWCMLFSDGSRLAAQLELQNFVMDLSRLKRYLGFDGIYLLHVLGNGYCMR